MAGIFSYAKTLWQDGVTAITAARLNHIEQGISDAADSIKTLGDSVSRAPLTFGGYIGTADVDWDNIKTQVAIVNYGNTIPSDVHAPDGAYGYGFLFSAIVNNGIGYQIYVPSNGETFYVRFTWGSSWIKWKKFSCDQT
ncbi:pyocin knob domain-containing protein [Collinsella sp. AM28-11LB]|uniref:pyocin knob domain-containing protein n=1 Tax=Collinsella sp. AM28-11LB TaxID=2292312 RepID=UPI000E555326|nr:pyocin knob domain-containing protein [Collinsella sp. AM28-11LB]RHE52300.1 hypothetical protein DW732_02860 [Collinsella sp. AM28-11LB]